MVASNTDGPVLAKGELTELARDAMNRIPEVMDRGEQSKANDKPVRILFFEVDPAILGYFQAGYNIAASVLSKFFSRHAYDLTFKFTKNQKVAAAAVVGVDTALMAGDYVQRIITGSRQQQKEKRDFARKLAPVLDELKGNHSAGAMLSVTAQQNEMIFAQNKRLAKQHEVASFGRFIDLVVNAGPNLALSLPHAMNYWKHGAAQPPVAATTGGDGVAVAASPTDGALNELKALGPQFINATVPAIAVKLKESAEKRLQRSQQPYSALEMVLKLEEEVGRNPGASAYAAPNGGGSFSLEEYIVQIINQHSKDMADVDHEYTELRKALRTDVEKIAKPIAEAIGKGDLAPITLIRWVGEGKLIKDKGRKIATEDEVYKLLGHAEKRPQPPLVVDPKEYYMDAAFNQKELKSALSALKGEERAMFAAMFPDAVLDQAGLTDQEVKAIRAQTLNTYEKMLAEAVTGLAALSDEQLIKDGLGQDEVKQLRDAVEAMNSKGAAAIHELRSNHANVNGVERALTNWAVPRVRSGAHLGTLLAKGREALTATPKVEETPAHAQEAPAKAGDAAEKTNEAAAKAEENKNTTDVSHEETDTHVAALKQQSASGEMNAEQAR